MKYKPGDEVLIKAEITDICPSSERPYFVAPDKYSVNWVSEEKIIPMGKTYSDGLTDAWELAKRIAVDSKDGGIPCDDLINMFNSYLSATILSKYTVEEALAKFEAYEKEKEIKVGDVVVIEGEQFIVTKVIKGEPNTTIDGLGKDGEIICYSARQFEKTGKHIDIESLLKEIGE